MTDERWQRVKALFQAAVERPAGERTAFLATAAGDDDDLRREVESLLASDARDSGVLDRLPIAADAVHLSASQRIGPYDIVALIGAGAMGEVYRARDTKLNRDVALKVLPPLFALDPDRVARFKREAQVLAALNHPNIAGIYGLEESDGVNALALELVEGSTLADRVASGALPLDEVIGVGRQIAEALEAAHEKGIIHRDLKPANVKITASGAVKVLDFGLAKAWEGAPDAQLSVAPTLTATLDRERTILGTPAYMSPEQARGRALDKRTDIWSFGCVLFEMLTGRSAFADETISDTLARVLDRDVDWHALPGSTPVRVRDLLRRCLQKDVNRRWRDIGDARLELEESSAPIEERSVEGRENRPGRAFRIAAAVTILALTVFGAVYLLSRVRAAAAPAFRQLTFRHGTITGARLAADGQTVVYRATWSGARPELFLIRPESLQSGSIGLVNAGIYSVSSRGELAVALGCRLNWGECLGTLAQVPITGGSPREMVKDVLVADWSPDGRNLAVVSFMDSSYRLEYPIEKILYQPKGWITDARVSPRADRIAFLDHDQLGDSGGSVSIVDLDGRKTTLSSDWKSLQGLAWSPSGDEVWFSGSRTGKGGSSTVYAVTLSGQQRTVFSAPGTLKLNDISRDGKRVLLTRGTTRGGIIGLDADGATERDLSWLDYSTVADLSNDGRTLLFYEWGDGVAARSTIFIRQTDGSDAVPLGEGRPLALSPDARWVVAVQENEPQQLVLLPAGTGDVKRLPRGPIVEYLDWAAWSPDGRKIFFAGRESADVRRTYVQDVDGGAPHPVTPDGFVGIVLSPNGRTIVAVDRYGEYYLCSTDASTEPRPLEGYRDGDVPLQWSADGRGLFIREAGNLVLRIHKLDLSTGTRLFWKELAPPDPTVLTDIGSDPGQVRITPDGKSYAYTYWTFEGELYLAEGLR
jgi:serine/threonine protein kinase/Tol biopolymer transport system component